MEWVGESGGGGEGGATDGEPRQSHPSARFLPPTRIPSPLRAAFGWYRRHFTVAEWQVAAAEAGSLNLALGTVAAANIAWINGKQVGGYIPSDPKSLNCASYGNYQQYTVPPGLLVGGGGDNVIAVRVLAQGGPANATGAAQPPSFPWRPL